MDERTYASPFSWRYGSAELRELFSERRKRAMWRAVWLALAASQARSGLVSPAELADLRAHA
ncbi:MAG: adenylosuccinate lyase, partial [Vulcanimicrobiaceae bacterium]